MPERRSTKPRKTHAAKRIDAHIGARLRRRRLQCRIPSAFLARYLGVGRDELAAYESGARELLSSQIFALSGLFSVSPDYFYAGLHDASTSVSPRKAMAGSDGVSDAKARNSSNRLLELTTEIVEEVAGTTSRRPRRKSGDHTH
ncbi:MAG TPA: helix-turn-helix transcriptional regulator [Alphaproteobacteria bacterium]|nr:helix-turn-helix transcriptional regulator [Alphaproteobacteria bacterium]